MKQILISSFSSTENPKESMFAFDFRDAIYYKLYSSLNGNARIITNTYGLNSEKNVYDDVACSDIALQVKFTKNNESIQNSCNVMCYRENIIFAKELCSSIESSTHGIIIPSGIYEGWHNAIGEGNDFCDFGGVVLDICLHNDIGELLSNKTQFMMVNAMSNVIVRRLYGK